LVGITQQGYLQPDRYARLTPWRDSTRGMKILLVVGMSAWIVGMASLLAVAGIETAALRQPHTAVGQYRHPNDIKGRVRFFTDAQEQVHSVASPLIFVSLIIFVAASVFYNGIQKRLDENRKNNSIDRYVAERDHGGG